MMTVLSLMYISPNAQVRPSRQSRAMAPITQDLTEEEGKALSVTLRPCDSTASPSATPHTAQVYNMCIFVSRLFVSLFPGITQAIQQTVTQTVHSESQICGSGTEKPVGGWARQKEPKDRVHLVIYCRCNVKSVEVVVVVWGVGEGL